MIQAADAGVAWRGGDEQRKTCVCVYVALSINHESFLDCFDEFHRARDPGYGESNPRILNVGTRMSRLRQDRKATLNGTAMLAMLRTGFCVATKGARHPVGIR